MSSTDHPVPGPDESGGEPDPAAPPSRARAAEHGWLPWAVGAVLVATQLVVLVYASGRWRSAGAAVVAVATLAVIGVAVFGGDEPG
ncbi:hypothetical protein [Catenulispora rubra]|uniref:hypothetical protein n=1 Tax=Catenulispora rubra TaxID=280293 RepID=UPI001891F3A2|nr:hypothetical protein [Catenulispora rubra]